MSWVILHGGALGDLALTIRLALMLPAARQTGSLTVVSRADPGDLSTCLPAIARRCLETVGAHWLYIDTARGADDATDEPPPTLARIVQGRDVLSALGGPETPVHVHLARLGPRRLFSFDPRHSRGGRHVTQQWRTALEAQGLAFDPAARRAQAVPALRRTQVLQQAGREALGARGCGAATVLIHPGAGSREKCWDWEGFLSVAAVLERAGLTVAFLVGPAELERWPADRIAAIAARFPLLRSPPPGELACVLAAARVLLSNDCGPAHLAALLGTPTLTLFGPTSPRVWRPLGPRARVICGRPQQDSSRWGIDVQHVARQVLALVRSAS